MNPQMVFRNASSNVRTSRVRHQSVLPPAPVDIPGFWTVVRRNRARIIIACSFCILAAFALAALQTPMFRAQALVEVQNVNENFLRLSDYQSTSPGGPNGAFIATHIRLLQSEALASAVASQMRLDENTSFFRESPRLLALKKTFGVSRAPEQHSATEAAARLHNSVRARLEGDSNLISIESEAPSPELAAAISNTLAARYIADEQDGLAKAAQQTSEWLTNQLEDVRQRLQNSERDLQNYAGAAGLLFLGENSTVTDEQLKQVQQELSRARALRAQQEAELQLISSAPADTLPRILDDTAMREYQLRLTDLQRQVADLGTTLTPEHYKVQRLRAEADVVLATIERRRASILNRIRNEYTASVTRESLLDRAYREQEKAVTGELSKAVRYNVLKRELDTNRELYSSMMQRAKEASLSSAVRKSSLRLVEPARPPERPQRPNLAQIGGFGVLSGLFAAVLLVLTKERLDTTIRRRGEITSALALPEIGVIPAHRFPSLLFAKKAAAGQHSNGTALNLSAAAAQTIGAPVNFDGRESAFTEAFHSAATSIGLMPHKRGDILLVTSPHPRAGKSTVVAHLGAALARGRRRAILIDGDFRRPFLHTIFGLEQKPGLCDVLNSDAPVAEKIMEVVRESPVSGLSVITAGNCNASSWRLFEMPRMADILGELKRTYDFVIIDSPPILHLTDSRILASLADSVLLVCRAGQTRTDQATEAARLLSADGSRLAGAILNDWNATSEDPDYLRVYRYYRSAS
jgi:succinoglycan biosynthesis transport protein ExoP